MTWPAYKIYTEDDFSDDPPPNATSSPFGKIYTEDDFSDQPEAAQQAESEEDRPWYRKAWDLSKSLQTMGIRAGGEAVSAMAEPVLAMTPDFLSHRVERDLQKFREVTTGEPEDLGLGARFTRGLTQAGAGLLRGAQVVPELPFILPSPGAGGVPLTGPFGMVPEASSSELEGIREIMAPVGRAAQSLRDLGENVQVPEPASLEGKNFVERLVQAPVRTTAGAVAENAPNLAATMAAVYFGGPAAGAMVGESLEAGAAYQDAMDSGEDANTASRHAVIVGTVNSLMEGYSAWNILQNALGKVPAKNFLYRFVSSGMPEFTTEAAQETTNMVSEYFNGLKQAPKSFVEGLLRAFESGWSGLFTGGPIGMMGGGHAGGAETQAPTGQETQRIYTEEDFADEAPVQGREAAPESEEAFRRAAQRAAEAEGEQVAGPYYEEPEALPEALDEQQRRNSAAILRDAIANEEDPDVRARYEEHLAALEAPQTPRAASEETPQEPYQETLKAAHALEPVRAASGSERGVLVPPESPARAQLLEERPWFYRVVTNPDEMAALERGETPAMPTTDHGANDTAAWGTLSQNEAADLAHAKAKTYGRSLVVKMPTAALPPSVLEVANGKREWIGLRGGATWATPQILIEVDARGARDYVSTYGGPRNVPGRPGQAGDTGAPGVPPAQPSAGNLPADRGVLPVGTPGPVPGAPPGPEVPDAGRPPGIGAPTPEPTTRPPETGAVSVEDEAQAILDALPAIKSKTDFVQAAVKAGVKKDVAEASGALLDAFVTTWFKTKSIANWSVSKEGIYQKVLAGVIKGHKAYQKQAQQEGRVIRGAYSPLDDGRALIQIFKNADPSTLPHELAHVFRQNLRKVDARLADHANRWVGSETDQWTRDQEERFARAFERWLRDGKAPTPTLSKVFEQFRTWLREVYKGIKGTQIDVELTPEIKAVFKAMLGGRVIWKEVLELSAQEREDLEGVKQEIAEGEPGFRLATEQDRQGGTKQWRGYGSTFPKWFQNKGYAKKYAIHAIDRAIEGKPLTEKAVDMIHDLLWGYQAEQEAKYGPRELYQEEGKGGEAPWGYEEGLFGPVPRKAPEGREKGAKSKVSGGQLFEGATSDLFGEPEQRIKPTLYQEGARSLDLAPPGTPSGAPAEVHAMMKATGLDFRGLQQLAREGRSKFLNAGIAKNMKASTAYRAMRYLEDWNRREAGWNAEQARQRKAEETRKQVQAQPPQDWNKPEGRLRKGFRIVGQGGQEPADVLKNLGPVAQELTQKVLKAHSNRLRYTAEWTDDLALAVKGMSRAEKKWFKENFVWAYEDQDEIPENMPNVKAFAEAWFNANEAAGRLGEQLHVKVNDPKHMYPDQPGRQLALAELLPLVRSTPVSDASGQMMQAVTLDAKSGQAQEVKTRVGNYLRDFGVSRAQLLQDLNGYDFNKRTIQGREFKSRDPETYVPHQFSDEVREALMDQSGPVWEAVKKEAMAQGMDPALLVKLAQGNTLVTRHYGSLENARIGNLPRTITLPDGRVVKVLEDDPGILFKHLHRMARRLAIIEQFGQDSAQYAQKLGEEVARSSAGVVDPQIFSNLVLSMWSQLSGQGPTDNFSRQYPRLRWLFDAAVASAATAQLSAAVIPNLFGGHLPSTVRMGVVPTIKGFVHAWTTGAAKEEAEIRMMGGLLQDVEHQMMLYEDLGAKTLKGVRWPLRLTGFTGVNLKINQAIAWSMAHQNLKAMLEAMKRKDEGFLRKHWGWSKDSAHRYLVNELRFSEADVTRMVESGPTPEDMGRAVQMEKEIENAMNESPATRPPAVNNMFFKLILAYSTYVRKFAKTTAYSLNEARHGNVAPLVRHVVAGQVTGAMIRAVRDWLKDREREDENAFMWLLNNFLEAGSLGLWGTVIELFKTPGSFGAGKSLKNVTTPAVAEFYTTLLDGLIRSVIDSVSGEELQPTVRPFLEAVTRSVPAVNIGRAQVQKYGLAGKDLQKKDLAKRLSKMVYTSRGTNSKGHSHDYLDPKPGREKNAKYLMERWRKLGYTDRDLLQMIQQERDR